jgi:tetratricopeptide (TPR) repeat protein
MSETVCGIYRSLKCIYRLLKWQLNQLNDVPSVPISFSYTRHSLKISKSLILKEPPFYNIKTHNMRTMFSVLVLGLFSTMLIQPASAQKKAKKETAPQGKTMTWTTRSEEARTLAGEGAQLFMNLEMPQAYEKFKKAVELDPDFTVALVFLSNLVQGETKKEYSKRALASAQNKTEGEKLFASTLKEGATQESNREVWAKLHEMFPDGSMIGNYYVVTRATPEERFAAAQEYIAKFPDQASMYNILGYYYMQQKKDMAKAKECFEKYIKLYPDGYNPYDSMGEYYLNAGDVANSKKYYSMAVDKYPFATNSIEALQKINDNAKKEAASKQ